MEKKASFHGSCPWTVKILKIMRLTLFLLLFSAMSVLAVDSYSQTTRLTLSANQMTLEQLLNAIEDQSEFRFFYTGNIDVEKRVNVKFTDESIGKVLEKLSSIAEFDYEIQGRQIVLSSDDIENVNQQKNLSGTVTDASGQPLPGVSIVIKGTTTGTITDFDGNFSLSNVSSDATLVFSFVGMKMQEIEVAGQSVVNVTMESDAIGLEEVVAIGYGTRKKATITGSVAAVKGEELKRSPAINVSNNLVGRLPGLIALNRTGEPGYDGSELLIRGSNTLNNNTPLVVIDGVTGRSMERLDPADIESISILKDASAAIYGSRAANGVILITTKRGKAGKPTITVNINQGASQPTRIPDMADAATYAQIINEINLYRDRDPKYTAEDIQKYRDGSSPWTHPNTDWFGETFKTWAAQRYANASVSGGTENMKYYVSLGGNFQDGIYKNSATYYKQYDFRSNLDGKISDHIKFAIDVSGRQENRHFPTRGAGAIFRMLIRGKPHLPAYWPDGTPGPDIEYGDNPVVVTTDETGYDDEKWYVFDSNLKLTVDIPWIKGLSFTTNAAIDKRIRSRKLFQKGWFLYSWDFETYDENNQPVLIKGKRGFDDPRLRQEYQDIQNITVNGLLNYKTRIGENHDLEVLLGMESFEGIDSDFWAYRRYFVSDKVDQLFAGGDLEKDNSGSAEETARLNYFGRVNYNFKEKILAEFVWRYDGSYIFPEESRYGFFPGISLGWRVSEEPFWKDNLGFLENFKLRASWGQTGNDRIDPYQYLSSYGFGDNGYIFNNSVESKTLTESRIPNLNVTWEVANQFNVGFDGEAFNGKLYFEADYFHNLRTDILWQRNASVPSTAGLSLPRENIGEVINQGFEYLLTYRDRVGELRYDVSLNGGYQKNEIKFWDETPGVPDYQVSTGKPMETDLYYQADGIFHTQEEVDAYPHWAGARPGDIKFVDVNDDGKIDGLDRVREDKNNIPRFQGGLNVKLAYKQFDLSVLFQGAFGAVQYYSTESGEIGNFLNFDADGRWTPENPDANKPRAKNRSEEYWANHRNTYFLRSTDYIRLKNLELGYNLPKSLCNEIGVEGLRIYFNGINLALLHDKFKVYDPETSNSGGTNYPQNRTINAGVTLTF